MKSGDIVKFVKVIDPGDEEIRMRIKEVNGDRVLVEALVDMQLKPTYVYPRNDVITCAF